MNASITNISKTAFIIAQWRVFETESVNPLFSDHIAHIFLDAETQQMTREITELSPSTRHLIGLRTKYIDDRLAQVMNSGVRQVVLLGAGLDTRPLRFALPHVRFFEIDHEQVLTFKKARLTAYGYKLNSTMIACNYIEEDWVGRLRAAGFSQQLSTYVIWEGNSMYIPAPDIQRLLSMMSNQLTDFTLSFDYLSQKLIDRTTRLHQSHHLVAGFQRLEAPWVTGFADISDLARHSRLRVLDNRLLIEFGKPYKPDIHLDSRLLDDYFICGFGR